MNKSINGLSPCVFCIKKYLVDLALVPEKKHDTMPTISSVRLKKWVHPEVEWVKMNVDAAIPRNQDRVAFAAICRDHTGLFLGASAVTVDDLFDPETLEAMARNEGLLLALEVGVQKVQITTDCSAIVKHIQEPFLTPSKVVVEKSRQSS